MLVVRAGHASGRYQPKTPDTVNLVLYGTYGEPLQTRGLPEEVAFAGRRYQLTLGPFPDSVAQLRFRFECRHQGCPGTELCCDPTIHAVQIGTSS